jgi:hypothetical protein
LAATEQYKNSALKKPIAYFDADALLQNGVNGTSTPTPRQVLKISPYRRIPI